jgi:hypothetical protein
MVKTLSLASISLQAAGRDIVAVRRREPDGR